MSISAFPKIFALGTVYISDIFDGEVEITEKLDGSQFGFGRINGELVFRSKGKQQFLGGVDKMFQPAVDYVLSVEKKIPDNVILYGEMFNKPRHNVLAYTNKPKNGIALFGVCDNTHTRFSYYETVKLWADTLDVDAVPLIHKGKISDISILRELLDRESYLGGVKIEGIVVKNYAKTVMVGGQVLPVMSGKFVSEQFKEVAKVGWTKENTGRGQWDTYVETFRTNARWNKAIQHLREKGELTDSPKDIGALIKEVKEDIAAEEKENIKEFLWKTMGQDILRRAVAGLPEYYKQQLLEKAVECNIKS